MNTYSTLHRAVRKTAIRPFRPTFIHPPDTVLALQAMLPPDSVTVCVAINVPVLLALKLNELGLALRVPDDCPVTLKITGN